MQHGYKVKNLSGGYKAYKIVTEKQSNEGVFDDISIRVNDVVYAASQTPGEEWNHNPQLR